MILYENSLQKSDISTNGRLQLPYLSVMRVMCVVLKRVRFSQPLLPIPVRKGRFWIIDREIF